MKFETKLIHAGQKPDKETGAVNAPVYQTSTFKQDGIENTEDLIKDVSGALKGL